LSTAFRNTANRSFSVELDRAAAIGAAIADAKHGDVVLIAGKGHEDYQERNGVRQPFSDAECAQAALATWSRRMMDTATAARIVQGRLIGANLRFSRVSTDTRSLCAGDLYVALKGERFDGHDFVAAALAQGAVAAVIAAERAEDMRGELIAGARSAHRASASCGALAQAIRDPGDRHRRQQWQDHGQGNAGVGAARAFWWRRGARDARQSQQRDRLAADIAGTRTQHHVAAIELGMNHAGETAELAAIAQPTVALINNAQREHQEFMHSVAEVAAEHAALIRALPDNGIAVLNADDANIDVWRAAARTRPGIVDCEFALDHSASVRGHYASATTGGGVLEVTTPTGHATLHLAAPGRHNASNALAATAAAIAIGVPLDAVVKGLEAFRPVEGRLVAQRGRDGAIVIDDTYNANPDSVRAAIDVLAQMPGTKWLALGDMGEIGHQGPAFHREIGEYARAAGVDRLLTAGSLAAESAAAFGAGAEHFASVDALSTHLAEAARTGTTVLVKGSRFMRMERVVAALTGETSTGGPH
jgi:murE/murF fusion protein